MKKGYYFSFDGLIALTLLSASLFLVMQSGGEGETDFQTNTIEYQKANLVSRDSMKLSSINTFSYFNSSFQQELIDETVMEEEDMNRTILDGLTYLWAAQNFTHAKIAAKTYYDSKIPDKYGYRIQVNESGTGNVIYNNSTLGTNESVVSSVSRLVSGHRIGEPSEGYQARTRLTRVNRRKNKTVTFGGYVGDGNVTSNVTIARFDSVLNVDLEGDFSGPFKLVINGVDAGTYSPTSGNISADSFDICTDTVNPSRCEAFTEGDNTVKFEFQEDNRSISGGFLTVTYNQTEELSPLTGEYAEKRKKIPGINGVINYYGSFFVPGNIQGINAYLHYKTDNQTAFMKIGNSTVYKDREETEQTVSISNESIHGNLTSSGMDYDFLSERTVPLRVGLKNLDFVYSRAIADSVAVIDNSGSMSESCGSFDDFCENSKIDNATDASKEFVDIILNATGNRAGVVGYETDITVTHELSDDQSSLDSSIDSMVGNGGTCIACGILEAVEIVKKPKKETIIGKKSEWNYNNSYLDSAPPEQNGDNWTEIAFNHSNWTSANAIIGNSSAVDTEINSSGSLYFRKNFDIDPGKYEAINVGIRSDDAASIYINGVNVLNESGEHSGSYWNKITGSLDLFDSKEHRYDSFESGSVDSNWTFSGGYGVTSACGSVNGSNSLVFQGDGDAVFESEINSTNAPVNISYWVLQTSDSTCAQPESGEDLNLEYRREDGSWATLKSHPGGGSDPSVGDWERYEFRIPEDGRHKDASVRFSFPDSNNFWDSDYWAVDSINLTVQNGRKLQGIDTSILNGDENVAAVKVRNDDKVGEFDLFLNATERRKDSMIVMSDGEATQESSMTNVPNHDGDSDTTDDPQDHAIEAGCRAGEQNITVYAIGFGSNADDETLNDTAECGNGTYYESDTGELKDVFRNISRNILNASYVGQTIETSDESAIGQLYDDSYIEFNYSGVPETDYGAITVEKKASNFGTDVQSPKNGSYYIPQTVEPVSARTTSYSGNRWADRLLINDTGSYEYVYNLWKYDQNYVDLGDPFILNIPRERLLNGWNFLQLDTAFSKSETRGGSPDNTVFYRFNVENFVGYGDLFPTKQEARDDAEQRLKDKLDVDGDGDPVISVDQDSFNYSATLVDEQPYIWGPASIKLVVWRE